MTNEYVCGVGCDLDVIAIINEVNTPSERRELNWNLSEFPVLVDLLIYTADEWRKMKEEKSCFALKVEEEVIWLFKGAEI